MKLIHYTILLTVIWSSQSLLVTITKVDGKYLYNPSTTIVASEVGKFIISAMILRYQGNPLNFRINGETMLYSIPALIYFIQNMTIFTALNYVDPTMYLILSNLKIVTTGFC